MQLKLDIRKLEYIQLGFITFFTNFQWSQS